MRQLLPIVVTALVAAAPAHAVPILRLVLHGDARTLGAGAADLFLDPSREAVALRRPALLAGALPGPAFMARADREDTLRVGPGARYAGTSAAERRAASAFLLPLPPPWNGAAGAVAAELGAHKGHARLVSPRLGGEVLRVDESREVLTLVASFQPAPWLALGASAAPSREWGTSWSAEVLVRAAGFSAGWRRAVEAGAWEMAAPSGVSKRIRTPPVSWDVRQVVKADRLVVAFDHPRAFGELSRDLRWPNDAAAALSVSLGAGLVARLAWERRTWTFDNLARANDADVAQVNLGIRRERAAVGAEHPLGPGTVSLAYARTRLGTRSAADDTGPAAARALFNLEADLGLFFGHDMALDVHQLALGYRHDRPEGLSWRAGAQYLRGWRDEGDVRYGSTRLSFLSEDARLKAALADLVALTGGLGLRVGRFELWWSAAQLVPVHLEEDAGPPLPPKPLDEGAQPAPPPKPRPSFAERVERLLDTYSGGTLHTFELVHRF